MSYTGCEEFLVWFSKRQAADPVLRQRLLDAMTSGHDPIAAVTEVIGDTDSAAGRLVAMEVAVLPSSALRTMLRAWREATEEGLAFSAHSVRPDRPLEFARRRLVRVTVDRDDSSVSVQLSHIPTRHPHRSGSEEPNCGRPAATLRRRLATV